MARVVWPDQVIGQLDEITAYIAQDNPVAATRFAERIIALGESLASFPERGRPAGGDAREMTSVPLYILRYRIVDETVVIVAIRHGRRKPLP